MSTVPAAVNYWPQSSCAKAFWSQHEAPAYQRLLADTATWLDPQPGDRWLDLGCGCGQLTQALWVRSSGQLAQVIASDCAAANALALEKLRAQLVPPPGREQLQFATLDFSEGLHPWKEGQFDGVVSGLALQYAQSYSEERHCWTTDAYDHLLAEIHRVLRPGGRLVFSVNVPEPSWGRVALHSLTGVWHARRPVRYLKNAWRMLRYGRWLKAEARRGRFHYLPVEEIRAKLAAVSFTAIEHRLTYAGQAFLLRCRKPLVFSRLRRLYGRQIPLRSSYLSLFYLRSVLAADTLCVVSPDRRTFRIGTLSAARAVSQLNTNRAGVWNVITV